MDQNPPPLVSSQISAEATTLAVARGVASYSATTLIVVHATRLRPRRTVSCPWTPPDHGTAAEARNGRFLLSALLHVATHKLFRVLLQYGVDFVQKVVDILSELLVPFGRLRVCLGCWRLVDLLVLAGLAGLRLAAGVTGRHDPSSSPAALPTRRFHCVPT